MERIDLGYFNSKIAVFPVDGEAVARLRDRANRQEVPLAKTNRIAAWSSGMHKGTRGEKSRGSSRRQKKSRSTNVEPAGMGQGATGNGEVTKLLKLAKSAILAGENSYREATEYLLSAAENRTQREMQKEMGVSLGTINALLAWGRRGYSGTPFQRKLKDLPQKHNVQPPEQVEAKFVTRAKEADSSLEDENENENENEEDADSKKYRWGSRRSGPVRDWDRQRFIKLLGMLGSNSVGERASAALHVEGYRKEKNMSWDDLIVADLADDPVDEEGEE